MNKEIFITDIKINKIRHLENIDIPLSKTERKHLIITGQNGSGKTSLLEALRDLLVAYETEGFSSQNDQKSATVTLEFNALDLLAEKWKNHKFTLSFFEAKRRTSMEIPQGPQKSRLKNHYKIDSGTPNEIFQQYLVNLKVEQSFARDDDDIETVEKIKQWFNMLEDSFGELFEDEHLRLKFDRKNYNFYFVTKNREKFDFNTLSDGYSAVINIFSDLIIRMENQRTEAYDVQGIVLIDEIETHLHVELQKNILPFMKKFFPKIQLIVSTHSPFVLTSLNDAIIYDLEYKIRVEDLSPYSYHAVVERYFEVDKYSTLISAQLTKYERLLKKDNKTEAEKFKLLKLRNYLKKVPSDFAPELVAHFQTLELLSRGKIFLIRR